ncbi:MAG: hypothetical protein ACLTDI_13450 [Acutalibacteraceae bacterium]
MAVMMVIGNANLFPSLLGKSESIAAVIALEMGTAVVGKHPLPRPVRGGDGIDAFIVPYQFRHHPAAK